MAVSRPRRTSSSRRPAAAPRARDSQHNKQLFAAVDRSMARIEFALDGTVVAANENFLSLMGYTLEEVVGKPHATFVDEHTRSSSQYATFWAALRRGEFQRGRFRRLKKDGQDVWLEATYSPIIDDSGRVQGVLKLASDITTSVQKERENEQLQQRYFEMVENTSVRLILADRDSKIIYMNPASVKALKELEEYLPCKVEDIVGQSFDIFHKRPEHQRQIVADPDNLPHRAKFPLGNDWLDLTASPLRDSNGVYMGPLVTWEVITEQVKSKQQEEQLQEALVASKNELERKVKALVEVFSAYGPSYTLPEIMNMRDLSEDEVLRKRMDKLLHLIWADWAVGQVAGVRGGGRTRIYQDDPNNIRRQTEWGSRDRWRAMSKILLNESEWWSPRQVPNHPRPREGGGYANGDHHYECVPKTLPVHTAQDEEHPVQNLKQDHYNQCGEEPS